jgi:hypothetical protein
MGLVCCCQFVVGYCHLLLLLLLLLGQAVSRLLLHQAQLRQPLYHHGQPGHLSLLPQRRLLLLLLLLLAPLCVLVQFPAAVPLQHHPQKKPAPPLQSCLYC